MRMPGDSQSVSFACISIRDVDVCLPCMYPLPLGVIDGVLVVFVILGCTWLWSTFQTSVGACTVVAVRWVCNDGVRLVSLPLLADSLMLVCVPCHALVIMEE
ncbi:hypothetical protein CPAR01_06188 [Colletotrichum paranaense]|uniref:Transmembrane protein n=1 Tax=Colletotrichum paranaense TaxID=1914294 RepID=A0ABQ9STE4_9PEZI|nr:uncharacterized protein CPAR01_06188 [Colletotrichum paranaense]KAK1542801.1 hypothetical protein CPAR01_06188 [Colletotrichum paranaense]